MYFFYLSIFTHKIALKTDKIIRYYNNIYTFEFYMNFRSGTVRSDQTRSGFEIRVRIHITALRARLEPTGGSGGEDEAGHEGQLLPRQPSARSKIPDQRRRPPHVARTVAIAFAFASASSLSFPLFSLSLRFRVVSSSGGAAPLLSPQKRPGGGGGGGGAGGGGGGGRSRGVPIVRASGRF